MSQILDLGTINNGNFKNKGTRIKEKRDYSPLVVGLKIQSKGTKKKIQIEVYKNKDLSSNKRWKPCNIFTRYYSYKTLNEKVKCDIKTQSWDHNDLGDRMNHGHTLNLSRGEIWFYREVHSSCLETYFFFHTERHLCTSEYSPKRQTV